MAPCDCARGCPDGSRICCAAVHSMFCGAFRALRTGRLLSADTPHAPVRQLQLRFRHTPSVGTHFPMDAAHEVVDFTRAACQQGFFEKGAALWQRGADVYNAVVTACDSTGVALSMRMATGISSACNHMRSLTVSSAAACVRQCMGLPTMPGLAPPSLAYMVGWDPCLPCARPPMPFMAIAARAVWHSDWPIQDILRCLFTNTDKLCDASITAVCLKDVVRINVWLGGRQYEDMLQAKLTENPEFEEQTEYVWPLHGIDHHVVWTHPEGAPPSAAGKYYGPAEHVGTCPCPGCSAVEELVRP